MAAQDMNTYDFLINDEDEVMLLLYVHDGEPHESSIELDLDNKSAVLHRTPTDEVYLDGIPNDVLDSMQESDKLLVCELSIEKNDKDTKIVYAYEADITD